MRQGRTSVIVQDDRFDATASITVCPLAMNSVDAPLRRIPVEPSLLHTLDQPSRLMVDQLITIRAATSENTWGGCRVTVFLGLAD